LYQALAEHEESAKTCISQTGNGIMSFWDLFSKLLWEKHIRFEERILFNQIQEVANT